MKIRASVACAMFLLAAISSFAQRGMMPEDTLRVATVGDAQIAPDGSAVVYTVSANEGNTTHTTLWIASTSETRRTTSVPLLSASWEASNPRWSPDGKRVAFLSARENQTGLWIVSLTERQPRFVAPVRSTNFFITYAGEPLAWSPDSRRIAYINATEETDDATNANARREDDPRVIDRIQYKSRTSFSDRLRTHVWVTDVDNPAPRQLTSGATYDHALTWNPRGEEIAYLSNHEPDPDAVNNSDIFAVSTDGRMRQITETKGCEYEPAWSPDGKWIAYTATTRDVTTIDSVAEDTHVWVIDAAGGRGRELTAAQDRRARSPHWSPESNVIFFLAGDHGQTLIYRVGANGGAVRPVFNNTNPSVTENTGAEDITLHPFQISGFTIRPGQIMTCAFTLSDALHPAEVWIASIPPIPTPRVPLSRLSRHNDPLLRTFAFVEPEEISFRSFDGTRIQGWLMKPVGWREDGHYPLILSIHGGPHGAYGYSFNAAFQAYAARGYAVLYINPRGSTGYGQKFSDGTLREWGGGDYKDLMAGVDEVLRTHSWIDRNRLGVTGGSYGGFMTNWIITQTPRFRAAVASASVSNLISFYSTSLYQDLIHAEFGGAPWDDFDLLWRWSPLHYVSAIETPTLFIHGEQDNDVHITQAEEMYMALRRRGVETILVRYPREGHGLREPHHRTDALERTLAWFDKFLK